MLLPKKLKHRKQFRGKRKGISTRTCYLSFGSFGIKAQERGWLTSRQLEAARRAITRYMKRGGKVWIRVFPDRVVTKTAAEVGMGGGKGAPDHFVATVKPGTVIFECDGLDDATLKHALVLGKHKLPVKTTIISRPYEK